MANYTLFRLQLFSPVSIVRFVVMLLNRSFVWYSNRKKTRFHFSFTLASLLKESRNVEHDSHLHFMSKFISPCVDFSFRTNTIVSYFRHKRRLFSLSSIRGRQLLTDELQYRHYSVSSIPFQYCRVCGSFVV